MRQLPALRGPSRKPGKAKRDLAQDGTHPSPEQRCLKVSQQVIAKLAAKVCRIGIVSWNTQSGAKR